MWQHILALPLAAKAITLLGVAALGVWAWVKHKAISEVSGAATKAAESRLLGWFAKKLYAVAPPPSPPISAPRPHNEKTYRGTLRQYSKQLTFPHDHFFVVEHEGTTETVPVVGSQLLENLQPGDFVEIDTLTGANYWAEIVQRVRQFKEEPKPPRSFPTGPANSAGPHGWMGD
jgi:hypothetical protein